MYFLGIITEKKKAASHSFYKVNTPNTQMLKGKTAKPEKRGQAHHRNGCKHPK